MQGLKSLNKETIVNKTCAELQTELDNATDTFTRHAITLILANRAVRLEAELELLKSPKD